MKRRFEVNDVEMIFYHTITFIIGQKNDRLKCDTIIEDSIITVKK